MSRLDPRSPFVLDTRELGRRPGAMSVVVRQVPAPTSLSLPVIAVRPGSALDVEVRLESVVEGVLVSGTATATAVGECVRCLDPVELPLTIDLQELFVHPADARDRSAPTDDEGDDLHPIQDDLIDLEPVLRDLAVLALPLKPLCSPDCLGLCSECGARLADDPSHTHDVIDPRWAALASITDSSVASTPPIRTQSVSQEES